MKKLLKKAIGVMIITLCTSQVVFAQGNTYKTSGNNNGTSGSKLGWKNCADLNVVTNDSTRMIVKKDGNVEIMKNLVVDGKITGDSIHIAEITCDSFKVRKFLTADSIHVRSIRVGDSSLSC